MKNFLKIFLIALLAFSILGFIVIEIIQSNVSRTQNEAEAVSKDWYTKFLEENPEKESNESLSPEARLAKKISTSKNINVLIMGLESQGRADALIVAFCNPHSKKVKLLSIPRDTYFYEEGYEDVGHKKINSYYLKKPRQGDEKFRREKGMQEAVSKLLSVPIHHYVSVDYQGVEDIINTIGGITVDVPFHMKYDDPTDKPPLHIDIPKGSQHLDGLHTLHFFRYRKGNGNSGGYPDGDLGRIKAQQGAIKQILKKSLSLKLPSVIQKSFSSVKTDLSLSEMMAYGLLFSDFDANTLSMDMLFGEDAYMGGFSFYLMDKKKTEQFIDDIYSGQE